MAVRVLDRLDQQSHATATENRPPAAKARRFAVFDLELKSGAGARGGSSKVPQAPSGPTWALKLPQHVCGIVAEHRCRLRAAAVRRSTSRTPALRTSAAGGLAPPFGLIGPYRRPAWR